MAQDNVESEPTLLLIDSSTSSVEIAKVSLEINSCFGGEDKFNPVPLVRVYEVPREVEFR